LLGQPPDIFILINILFKSYFSSLHRIQFWHSGLIWHRELATNRVAFANERNLIKINEFSLNSTKILHTLSVH